MVPVGDHVDGAQVAGDDRIIHDPILESSQIVVERDDVFLEGDAGCQRDPTLVAFHARGCRRKPFVQPLRCTDETPHGVGVSIDEEVSPNRSHTAKLLGEPPVDRSELMSSEVLVDL